MEEGKGCAPEKCSSSLILNYCEEMEEDSEWGSTGLLMEESSINIIDNNIAKIIRTYSTRYFCRCFSIVSHSITFEALTPHIYRNNSSFRSILKGLIPSREVILMNPACSDMETFIPITFFSLCVMSSVSFTLKRQGLLLLF